MIVVCGEALIDLVPANQTQAAAPAAEQAMAAEQTLVPAQAGDPLAPGASGGIWRAAYGGGPANTAVALARLGTPAALACRLSDDAFGRQLRRYLLDSGVDLRLAVAASQPTTLAVVALDQYGGADYQFYINGTADWQWATAELPDDLPDGTVGVHIGSLASILPPGAEVLRRWLAAHRDRAAVTYDVNVRSALLPDRDAYRTHVAGWLDVAHVLKASHDDLAWLDPDRDPLDVARAWVDRYDLTLALVTLGPYGAVAVPRGQDLVRVPGVHVDVVDTVGAGDTFTAAFLHWLASRGELTTGVPGPETLTAALDFAVAAAAIVCTREGAQPPTLAEVEELLRARNPAEYPAAPGPQTSSI
jgi:fructokinase